MQCENCRKERERGREYWFHYGKKVLETEKFDIDKLATIKNTRFLILGEESAWICNRCSTLTYRVMLGGLIAAGVVGSIALIGMTAEEFGGGSNVLLGGVACLGLPWLTALIFLILRKMKMSSSIGEEMAIRAKKDSLKHQGIDTFFNTVEYLRLQKSM